MGLSYACCWRGLSVIYEAARDRALRGDVNKREGGQAMRLTETLVGSNSLR